jgi:hypothetical protein
LGMRGRQAVGQHFSIERMAQNLVEAYRGIVARPVAAR